MTTPAGWYPDPDADGQQRYWDGEQWTEHRAPGVAAEATADPAAAADATTIGPAVTVDPTAPAPANSTSGPRGKILGGVAAGILVIAAGAFAATQLAGADGGSESPEAAVESLFEAISEEDLVGIAEVVLPGERRTFIDPALEGLGHLQRWGVLADSFDDRDISGIDLEVDGLALRTESVADDIVNVYASGRISAEIDGASFPIGDLVQENLPPDADPSELDVPRETETFEDVMMTAVREDGRWYVSGMYTVAEHARAEAGVALPATGIAPIGAGSPEEAVDGIIQAINDVDLAGLVARWNPDEAQALQRYAPIFLDDAQAELDQAMAADDVSFRLEDVEYDVVRRGDLAVVQFSGATLRVASGEDEGTVTIDSDGCITATFDGETEEMCTDTGAIDLTDTPMGDLEARFADMDDLGLVVTQRGGQWFVSPIRTYSETFLAFARVIDREDLERFIEVSQDGSLEAWIEGELEAMLSDLFQIDTDDLLGGIEGVGSGATTDPDRDVEALVASCEDGDMADCDQLYWITPIGSDAEMVAMTCGGTLPRESGGTCVARTDGTPTASTTPTTTTPVGGAGTEGSYGSDPVLDTLWDLCELGEPDACEDLYWESPIGSEYEHFAMTCGERREASSASCEELLAS